MNPRENHSIHRMHPVDTINSMSLGLVFLSEIFKCSGTLQSDEIMSADIKKSVELFDEVA